MAAAIFVPNHGSLDLSSTRRFGYSESTPRSASSILRQKRSFVEDADQFQNPSPAKKIRFRDHVFHQDRQKRSFVEDVDEFQNPSPAKKIRFRDHVFHQDDVSTQPVKLPTNKVEWVDVMIKEMMGSTSVDDAKSRSTGLFECLEKAMGKVIDADSEASADGRFQEKIETLAKENWVLKKAVTIQHQRQKEYENKNEEVKQLKELVGQYEEKVKNLEFQKYALTVHLHQALSSNPIPARFPPEVF